MTAHPDCGEPVVLEGTQILDPDGSEHLCRDYIAWHLPADPRHPDEMPWPAEEVRLPVPAPRRAA